MRKLIIALSLVFGTSQAMPWEIGQKIKNPEDYANFSEDPKKLDETFKGICLNGASLVGTLVGVPRSQNQYVVGKFIKWVSTSNQDGSYEETGLSFRVQIQQEPHYAEKVIPSELILNLSKQIRAAQ